MDDQIHPAKVQILIAMAEQSISIAAQLEAAKRLLRQNGIQFDEIINKAIRDPELKGQPAKWWVNQLACLDIGVPEDDLQSLLKDIGFCAGRLAQVH